MAYNDTRGTSQPSGGFGLHGLAIPNSLAVLVLIALVILFALRHIYGAVSVSAGTR